MNQSTRTILLRTSSILWVIWGLVHMAAGVLTVSVLLGGDIASAIGGIADGVDRSSLEMTYPAALGGILGQHGFNLFWFGLVTLIGAVYVWRGNRTAIWVTALVGGLADLGYFIFMDLGGFVNFVPGTVMTLVSSTAIILSFVVYFRDRQPAAMA